MRTAPSDSPPEPRPGPARTGGSAFTSILMMIVVVLGIYLLGRSVVDAALQGPGPSKPSGTTTSNPPTKESWAPATGLPTNVMRLTFSEADPMRGYASVFVTKQTQALYVTNDRGLKWHQAGTVQAPIGEVLATNPQNADDVVMLSVYAPVAGTYTFQRTRDGGRTWSAETAVLPATGMVVQTGWAGSTFLVGFQLDGQAQGPSAVVAFPEGQPGVHLDQRGTFAGRAIPHLRVLTGQSQRIVVWGDAGGSDPIGLATTDLGRTWTALRSDFQGTTYLPAASTANGNKLVALAADGQRVAASSDGGGTWAALPALPSGQAPRSVYITPERNTVVVVRDDGTYVLQGGSWSRATSRQAISASETEGSRATRLWASDTQQRIIWHDA